MEQEISVGAVVYKIIENKIKFLILNRSDKSEDFWEYPKGHQEVGESEIDTLKRELFEEINTQEIKIDKNYRNQISYISNSSKKERVIIYYLVKITEQISLSSEHNDYKWISLDEAKKYFEYDDMINLLKDALKKINLGENK